MKKFATLLAVVMVAVFSAGVIVAANAPEKAVINEVQKVKAPVAFPHKAHADRIKNCAECHNKEAARRSACAERGRGGTPPSFVRGGLFSRLTVGPWSGIQYTFRITEGDPAWLMRNALYPRSTGCGISLYPSSSPSSP